MRIFFVTCKIPMIRNLMYLNTLIENNLKLKNITNKAIIKLFLVKDKN